MPFTFTPASISTLGWIGILCALIGIIVLIVALTAPPRPRVAFLEGSDLDFIPAGESAYQVFTQDAGDTYNLLITQSRPIVEARVTADTVVGVCTDLYGQGVRIFAGMLESALLLPLARFAYTHPDTIFLSASSTIPRAGILPANVFRLYPSDVTLVQKFHKLLATEFPTKTRLVVVNGSPTNAWATAVTTLLNQQDIEGVTTTHVLTASEQDGTPQTNTVYVYAGDRANFTLADDMTGADIIIMSGNGWDFEVIAERNYMDANRVYTLDAINSMRPIQTTILRTETVSTFLGPLLQALQIAVTVDNGWDGRTSLSTMVDQLYGVGGNLLFTQSRDGNVEGLFLRRLRATACSNCFIGWIEDNIVDPVGDFFEDSVTAVVRMVTESEQISCSMQVASCLSSVQSGDVGNTTQACMPMLNPLDEEKGACLRAVAGVSHECLEGLREAVETGELANAATHCTVDMMNAYIIEPVAEAIIPFSLFNTAFESVAGIL